MMNDSDGNPYPAPPGHCSSEGRLLFLVCEALQLYPAGVWHTSVKRFKRRWCWGGKKCSLWALLSEIKLLV